jgi:AcrR family transcriptional regulator
MSSQPGLRERKKRRTRAAIAAAAHRLFGERGFDAVTVAEVARAADVSEGTVYNYFPTKEDLFYGGMEAFEAELVEAVGRRPPGEPVLAAFRRFVLDRLGHLADEEVPEVVATAARLVGASRALQAREREIMAHSSDALAALVAQETGAPADDVDAAAADVEAAAAAAALMGVQRALVAYVRSQVLGGAHGPDLAAAARAQAERAFARLAAGLGDYAPRPP